MLIDSSVSLDDSDIEIIKYIDDKNCIILLNKSDLPVKTTIEDVNKYTGKTVMQISSKDETGIKEFKEKIEEMFISGNTGYNDEIVITNERHLYLIDKTTESLNMVLDGINQKLPEDLISIDLMNSYDSLGSITGEKTDDDIIEEIFSKFCMGK